MSKLHACVLGVSDDTSRFRAAKREDTEGRIEKSFAWMRFQAELVLQLDYE